MREVLVEEISELERQISGYTDQLEQTDERTAKWHEIKAKVEEVKTEIDYKREKLAAISKAEKEQAIEEKVHSEITFAIPGVDFTKLPVELISVIHLVVKADRRKNFAEHAAELEKIETEAGAKIRAVEVVSAELTVHNNELKGIIETGKADNAHLIRENEELRDYTYQLNLENEDKDKKLANAVAQLEEAKAEIARLESQVDDYQKAKVLGERQAQAVIDVTANEADEINAAIKQLFVKSENWGSVEKLYLPDGTFKVVKRDELADWTAITPPPLLGGSETGAETFQDEDTQANAADGGVPAPTAPSLIFPSETRSDGLAEENVGVGVAGETVTREEFKALAARVALLEQSKVAVA